MTLINYTILQVLSFPGPEVRTETVYISSLDLQSVFVLFILVLRLALGPIIPNRDLVRGKGMKRNITGY